MKRPYVEDRDVTYEMLTTHKYFRTLSEQGLNSVLNYMDYNGWSKLPGVGYGKAKLLYKQFHTILKEGDICSVTCNIPSHPYNTFDVLEVINVVGEDILVTNNKEPNWEGNGYNVSKGGSFWIKSYHLQFIKSKQKQTNKMNNLQRKAAVLKAANELLFANNTVTTLEVKNKLRKDFKGEQWFQNTDFGSGIEGVSELMDKLASEGKFNYKNLGTYRVYTQGVTPVVTASSTPQSAVAEAKFLKGTKATTVVKPQPSKAKSFVSKTTVLNKVKNSNGRFISVTWTKNDGTDRTVVGQYVTDQKPNVFGYILVKDMTKVKAGKNAMVQVNPQTLKSVKTEGTLFVARQK